MTIPIRDKIGPLPSWIKVHWTSWRLAGDVVVRPDGLRVSSPLRTLFDLAGKLNLFAFERIAEDFWHLKLLDPTDASPYLEQVRRSGRGGVARFEEWIERVRHRQRPAQSGLELDVIEAIRDIGLPEPVRQHPLVLRSGISDPHRRRLAGHPIRSRARTLVVARRGSPGAPRTSHATTPVESWDGSSAGSTNPCGPIRRQTARLVKALYDSRRATFFHPAS